MAFELVGQRFRAADGALVHAEADLGAGQAHVSCTHHPALKNTVYGSPVNALLAASYHATGDTDQGHALNRKGI